ncbi:MAG: hypothetical protein RLN90_10350 [Balneolaceae bacterium]
MPFFNDNTANLVQLISAPLEIIGFTLAFIEIKYPEFADKIEHTFDVITDFLLKVSRDRLPKWNEDSRWLLRQDDILKALGWGVPLILLFLVSGFLQETDLISPNVIFALWLIVIPLVALFSRNWIGILISLPIIPLKNLFSFLNKFSKGRALGTVGLILASMGVFGELYQIGALFNIGHPLDSSIDEPILTYRQRFGGEEVSYFSGYFEGNIGHVEGDYVWYFTSNDNRDFDIFTFKPILTDGRWMVQNLQGSMELSSLDDIKLSVHLFTLNDSGYYQHVIRDEFVLDEFDLEGFSGPRINMSSIPGKKVGNPFR